MVEVSLSGRADGTRMVQLVNNSGIFGMSFVKPLPVEDIVLEIPAEGEPARVCSLHGTVLSWEYAPGRLTVVIPCLNEHEAIEIIP